MDNSSDEEEDQFFESFEEIASRSDSEISEKENSSVDYRIRFSFSEYNAKYEIWNQVPDSIEERRQRLFQGMGLVETEREVNFTEDVGVSAKQQISSAEITNDSAIGDGSQSMVFDQLKEDNASVLLKEDNASMQKATTGSDLLCSSSIWRNDVMVKDSDGSARSTISSESLGRIINESESSSRWNSRREYVLRFKNLDSGKEFIVDELGEDGNFTKIKEVDTDREMTFEEFEKSIGCSSIVRELMRREGSGEKEPSNGNNPRAEVDSAKKKTKKYWFKNFKLSSRSSSLNSNGSSMSCQTDRTSHLCGSFQSHCETPQRIKVCHHKKAYKEFSALFMVQEIKAHEGPVWAMKFSLDGRFLASAGQDRVIHVREVMESERKFEAFQPTGKNFNGGFSVVGDALIIEDMLQKRKSEKYNRWKKNSKSDLVLFPRKIFHLSERPLCSFHGHQLDVLDLSWSQSQYLLSASMDKTVRLWHLGRQTCLKTFFHNGVVTSVQFNPVDDRYFISGSLDKKVRIWNVLNGHVVDWSDLREIVTATSYTPDGKGGVVGTINGHCRFYNTSGNKLQLERKVSVGKKKKRSTGKITGFQFAPEDSRKVLITSADSRVRILDGDDVICKYTGGFQNTCSQVCASFTSNGKHFICASEDSRVYIWNYDISGMPTKNPGKITCSSNEHFRSQDVSVAIPWCGMASRTPGRRAIDTMPCQQSCPRSCGVKDTLLQNSFHSKEYSGRHDCVADLHNTNYPSHNHAPRPLGFYHSNQTSHSHESRTSTDSRNANLYTGRLSDLSGWHSLCTCPSLDSLQSSRGYSGNPDCVNASHAFFSESMSKGSATWPEEKLPHTSIGNLPKFHPYYETLGANNGEFNYQSKVAAGIAWGVVIVTAGHGGEIRTFQNYGLPIRP